MPIASNTVDITVSSTDAAAPTSGNATSATFVITGMTALNTAATASIALFTKPATWPDDLADERPVVGDPALHERERALERRQHVLGPGLEDALERRQDVGVSQSMTLAEGRDDVGR